MTANTTNNGKRTGKQTALLVISIVVIVFGAIALIASIAFIALGGAVTGMLGNAASEAGMSDLYNQAMNETGVGAALAAGSIALIIASVLTLLLGIFGVRASKNANKVMGVIVLAIISLVLTIIGLFTGGAMSIPTVISIILYVVIIVLGFTTKNDTASLRS